MYGSNVGRRNVISFYLGSFDKDQTRVRHAANRHRRRRDHNAMPITFGEQKPFTASDPLPRPNPAKTMPHMAGERLATMRKNLDTRGCCRWHRAGLDGHPDDPRASPGPLPSALLHIEGPREGNHHQVSTAGA
jgi:hypothetical protein